MEEKADYITETKARVQLCIFCGQPVTEPGAEIHYQSTECVKALQIALQLALKENRSLRLQIEAFRLELISMERTALDLTAQVIGGQNG